MSLTKKVISLLIFILLAFGASSLGKLCNQSIQRAMVLCDCKTFIQSTRMGFCSSVDNFIYSNVSCYLVNLDKSKRVEKIIYIYFIHLLINGSWSIFFFGLHLILVSLIIIGIIIFFVIWLMKLYYPINKLSSFLMVPYLMWLSYAFVFKFLYFYT